MDLYGGKGLDSTDNTGAASVAFKEGGEGDILELDLQ